MISEECFECRGCGAIQPNNIGLPSANICSYCKRAYLFGIEDVAKAAWKDA